MNKVTGAKEPKALVLGASYLYFILNNQSIKIDVSTWYQSKIIIGEHHYFYWHWKCNLLAVILLFTEDDLISGQNICFYVLIIEYKVRTKNKRFDPSAPVPLLLFQSWKFITISQYITCLQNIIKKK